MSDTEMKKTENPLIDPEDPSGSKQVEDAIAESLLPVEPGSAVRSALRGRLLDRVVQSRHRESSFFVVRRDQGEWRRLVSGVRVKMLADSGDSRSVLLELEPGASIPSHRHHEHEECVVLRGDAVISNQRFHEGDFHLAPSGSRHGTVSSRNGALLYLRGTSIGDRVEMLRDVATAWLPGDGDAPITVRADEGIWEDFSPGVQAKKLWSDGRNRSLMLRLAPGARVAGHPHPQHEDCLILEGEAFIGDTLLRKGEYQFAPAGTLHKEVFTDVGALLYVHGAADSSAHTHM